MGNNPVHKPWIFNLPWKMQTVVQLGLRGPDNILSPKVKDVCRWMRSICVYNADIRNSFHWDESVDILPTHKELQEELMYLPTHLVTHCIYALQIIGYEQPDIDTNSKASLLYTSIVENILHFAPESKTSFRSRLTPTFI